MLKYIFILSILLSLLFAFSTFFSLIHGRVINYEQSIKHPNDHFDPTLSRLSNLDSLEAFIDSLAFEKKITIDSIPEYVNMVDSVVRMRFYHGLQNYKVSENWISNILGKYTWSHFSAKVLPNDILKGQKAFCSQSSIVFQEVLKRKEFTVRSVLLPGHFCTEVLINDRWQFHDVSFKPSFTGLPSLSAQELSENPEIIKKAYIYSFADNILDNYEFYFNSNEINYGSVNSFPAKNMAVLHKVTYFLSWWGWIFFLALGFITWFFYQKQTKREKKIQLANKIIFSFNLWKNYNSWHLFFLCSF